MIVHEGEPAGFISYCSFHLKPNKSELDIWMNCESICGKGFGTDAIVSLGAYLNKSMGVNELIMRPSVRNERAIKAYMKAGFKKSDKSASYYLLDEYMPLYGAGDYGEGGDVLLVKQYKRMNKAAVVRHVDNIRELDNEGKLELCGVLRKCPCFAGMVILKADSFEEAEELCKREPLVIEGYATYKLMSMQVGNKDNNYLL